MAADIASALASWSTTEGSNSPSGSTAISTNLDDNLRMIQAVVRTLAASSSVSSASSVDLGAEAASVITISGTTTITSFGTVSAGIWKWVVFSGALTLTHNGTSLILPTGANITTAAGDCAMFVSAGSGNWRCLSYLRANGQPLVNSGNFSDGSASAPGIAFSNDSNTGIYRIGADSMGFSTNGTLRLTVDTSAITSTLKAVLPNGTEGAPALSFGDSDSGIYAASANTVSIAAAGVTGFRVDGGSSLNTSFLRLFAAEGIEVDSKFKFGNDPADVPSITAGGGTGATIAGHDQAFVVTAGTGSPTSVTVTFGTAFTTAPVCVATSSQSGLVLHVTPTTTTVQVSANAAISSGTKIHVMCFEYT